MSTRTFQGGPRDGVVEEFDGRPADYLTVESLPIDEDEAIWFTVDPESKIPTFYASVYGLECGGRSATYIWCGLDEGVVGSRRTATFDTETVTYPWPSEYYQTVWETPYVCVTTLQKREIDAAGGLDSFFGKDSGVQQRVGVPDGGWMEYEKAEVLGSPERSCLVVRVTHRLVEQL